jgi:hypothetical protein
MLCVRMSMHAVCQDEYAWLRHAVCQDEYAWLRHAVCQDEYACCVSG